MISSSILQRLKSHFGSNFEIQNQKALRGGSINEAAIIRSNFGVFFIKWNIVDKYPSMFRKEADSLKILQDMEAIRIPKVAFYSEEGLESFLLLEYIQPFPKAKDFWINFANSLRLLHKNTQLQFGLSFDNYIGSLPQSNRNHEQWTGFFVEERLLTQLKRARDQGLIEQNTIRDFEKLFTRLDNIFPMEQPSLLHGDLWSGNFSTDGHGQPCIFDPAIYYGHRVMDIAMTKMFGGFSPEFYEQYNQIFPMENNWLEQVDVANLYPNLVHLNLFGTTYLSSIQSILRQFR